MRDNIRILVEVMAGVLLAMAGGLLIQLSSAIVVGFGGLMLFWSGLLVAKNDEDINRAFEEEYERLRS